MPELKKKSSGKDEKPVIPPGYERADIAASGRMTKEADGDVEDQRKKHLEQIYSKEDGKLKLLPPLDEEGEPLMTSDALANLIAATYYRTPSGAPREESSNEGTATRQRELETKLKSIPQQGLFELPLRPRTHLDMSKLNREKTRHR